MNIHKQLVAMGQSVADQQYTNILLASLPLCYKTHICMITTNADETACDIDPTQVVKLITDNYDKRMLTRSKDNDENQAFVASGQKKDHHEIECFNCKKKGHIKANCQAKGGGKEGQRPNCQKPQERSSNIAATAADKKEEDLESWPAILAKENKESCNADNEDQSWATMEEISDEEKSVSIKEIPEEMANMINSPASHKVGLYDSGASRHISPFQDQLSHIT